MRTSWKIGVEPRFVKQDGNLRIFQKESLKAIKESKERIILVEAPVGSGKSHVIRRVILDEFFKEKPIILTYPTKILMKAQVGAMRKELEKTAVWPDESFIRGGINIFNYSSSSLISYIQKNVKNYESLEKWEILDKIIVQQALFSKKRVIVTSPDVLHILVNLERYGSKSKSRKIENYINNCFVFFDEFHLYYNLEHFPELINNLLQKIATKVILLSATPYFGNEFEKIKPEYGLKEINFRNSIGTERDTPPFNYPLEVEIRSFKYTNRYETLEQLKTLIPKLEKPAAVIFDSVFRLQHLKREIERYFEGEFEIKEWHGMKKSEKLRLTPKTVVLGTSSIEVGIDMNFKSLITEASYWTSAIQRVGRVGRKSDGKVIIFTKNDFTPFLKRITEQSISRDYFENEILKKGLNDPIGGLVSGVMFRGDSYNFVIQDMNTMDIFPYSEALFAMFEIDDLIDDWKTLTSKEKRECLEDWEFGGKIDEILLYDKIQPFWGVLKGRLKDNYTRVTVKYEKEDNELYIEADETFIFYGG